MIRLFILFVLFVSLPSLALPSPVAMTEQQGIAHFIPEQQIEVFQSNHANTEYPHLEEFSSQFFPANKKSIVGSGRYWLRFKVENNSEKKRKYFLQYEDLIVDKLALFDAKKGPEQVPQLQGLLIPLAARAYPSRRYFFPIELEGFETRSFYLLVDSQFHVNFRLAILSLSEIERSDRNLNLGFGLFFGLIIAMLVYNSFLYATFRQPTFLWYVLSQFFVQFLLPSSLHGFVIELFPNFPLSFSRYMTHLCAGFGVFFSCLFGLSFLRIQKSEKLSYFLLFFTGMAGLAASFLMFLDITLADDLVNIVGAFASILLLTIAVFRYFSGLRYAKFYILGTGIFLFSTLYYSLINTGVLPYSESGSYSLQFGGALEALMLGFALGQSYKQERGAALEVQKKLVTILGSSLETAQKLQNAQSQLECVADAVSALSKQLPAFELSNVYVVLSEAHGGTKHFSHWRAELNGTTQAPVHFVPCFTKDLPLPTQLSELEHAPRTKFLKLSSRGFDEGYVMIESLASFKFDSADLLFLEHVETAMVRALESLNYIEILKRANKIAEGAKKTQTEFLANVSHELRTPLTAIQGFAELLQDEDPTQAVVSEYASVISRNTNNLVRLVDDLLDVVKVESGQMQFESLPVSLPDLCDDVIRLFSAACDSKKIALVCSVEPNLHATLRTDPTRLRQILFNLVGNAIKFTQAGAVHLKVIERILNDGTLWVVFQVHDSGCGIAALNHEQIFKPFTQADSSTSRKYGGTGLGLSLSHKLAQGLGGEVRLVTSAPEKGSLFELSVPYSTGPL